MTKVTKIRVKDRVIPMKAQSELFGRLALIMQSRNVDLKEVFSYPLGPQPWPLTTMTGGLRKTNKVALLHKLEKGVESITSNLDDAVIIIDGMALVQTAKTSGLTFGELAKQLLTTSLAIGNRSTRIDIVFDQYRKNSIKNAERSRRGVGSLLFKSIIPSQSIQQWGSFLSSWSNKKELIAFIVDQWKSDKLRAFLDPDKELYVTANDKCWRLTNSTVEMASSLHSNQEEADTKMLLHAQHASLHGFQKIVINTPDTDVFIITLSCLSPITSDLFLQTGKRDKRRIINLQAIKESLDGEIPETEEYSIDDFMSALPGLHSFTGCDSTSAFSGKGKVKALKLMINSARFVTLFQHLGTSWDLEEEINKELEIFTCRLYGSSLDNINDVRYKVYCGKRGKVALSELPPCRNTLSLHNKRANYQCRIWRLCLEANPEIENPNQHGWIEEGDDLCINWMDCQPAPDSVST